MIDSSVDYDQEVHEDGDCNEEAEEKVEDEEDSGKKNYGNIEKEEDDIERRRNQSCQGLHENAFFHFTKQRKLSKIQSKIFLPQICLFSEN